MNSLLPRLRQMLKERQIHTCNVMNETRSFVEIELPLLTRLVECVNQLELVNYAVEHYAEKGLIENYVRALGMGLSDYIDDSTAALQALRDEVEKK